MKKLILSALFLIEAYSFGIVDKEVTPFRISDNSQDNLGLWITLTVQTGSYSGSHSGVYLPSGATYILADNAPAAWEGIVVYEMTTFLNNANNVAIKPDPNNPNKPNWQDGIVFLLFKDTNSCLWVAAYNANDISSTSSTPTPLIVAQLAGSQPSPGYNYGWGGSFVGTTEGNQGIYYAYPYMVGLTLPQAILYKTGSNIGFASSTPQPPAVSDYAISPVVGYKIPNISDSSQLWLQMMIVQAGKNSIYDLMRNVKTGTPNIIPVSGVDLYNALNKLSIEDWNGGIYFSFVGSNGTVSLYVQDATGKKIGEAIIPNISSLAQLNSSNNNLVYFQGSDIPNWIGTNSYSTICFTTNAAANAYVRIPLNVNDAKFQPVSVSTVQQVNIQNLSKASDFWLTMELNNQTYVLAKGSTSGGPSSGQSLTAYGTTGPDVQTFFNNLALTDLSQGIYFNLMKLQNQVFLNIQVGDGLGNISTAVKYKKSQLYLLPGITNINGNISFGGTNMQNATNIFPYQTFAVVPFAANNYFSNVGPINIFPTVCSYYQTPETLSGFLSYIPTANQKIIPLGANANLSTLVVNGLSIAIPTAVESVLKSASNFKIALLVRDSNNNVISDLSAVLKKLTQLYFYIYLFDQNNNLIPGTPLVYPVVSKSGSPLITNKQPNTITINGFGLPGNMAMPYPFLLNTAPGSFTVSSVQTQSFGVSQNGQPSNTDTSGLWLRMRINGNAYYLLAKNSNAGSNASNYQTLLPNFNTNVLNTLSAQDWQTGIYFSLIQGKNEVHLCVQKADGAPLNISVLKETPFSIAIPNTTTLANITDWSFKGSFIADYVTVPSTQTLGLYTAAPDGTNSTISSINQYIIRSNDVASLNNPNLPYLSTVVHGQISTSGLWISMNINGTYYRLVDTVNKFPNINYLDTGTTTPGPLSKMLTNLTTPDWTAGVLFSFVKNNSGQTFLGINGGRTNQLFLILGMSDPQNNIIGTVQFGASYMTNSVNILPYQTLCLSTSSASPAPVLQILYGDSTSISSIPINNIVNNSWTKGYVPYPYKK